MATDRAGYIGRNVQSLFEAGSFAGLSDGQLLERFHDSGEDVSQGAFAALVERHGPMVLRTCQRILRNNDDAHDAFQATFLVLLRKSRSLWVRESLGPWLHRVACRAALRARTARARRQTAERDRAAVAGDPAASCPSTELLAVLHEELDRLPAHYRAAIVLCDLEGHTCEQTARYLGCPIGTVGSRLVRGREKLRGRLIRRGLAPAAGTIAAAVAHDAALGAIPTPLVENTARAAIQYSAHPATGIVSFAAARIARDLSRSLLMTKLQAIAAVGLAAAGLIPVSVLSYRAAAGPQPPTPGSQVVEKITQKPRKIQQKSPKPEVENAGTAPRGNDSNETHIEARVDNVAPLKDRKILDVQGKSDVDLVVRERRRVVDVDSTTTFQIRLRNYGTKEATGLHVSAKLSDNFKVIETSGLPEGTSDLKDGLLKMPDISRLGPGKEMILGVKVKVVKAQPKFGTCRVYLQHQDLTEPLEDMSAVEITTGSGSVRDQSYLIASIGNSLFDRNQRGHVAPVSREAILYRDGTAKLWSLDSENPVCPPLRDTTPIREVAFRENLLVTAAETSVKIWNAVTGELLKDIPGQIFRPLAFLGGQNTSGRFVTVSIDGREVTAWDDKSLAEVDRLQVSESGAKPIMGAALSPDGGTLTTIAKDRSFTLWDMATKQPFATVRPPSQLSARVFLDDASPLFKRPVLQVDDHFWKNVAPLKPAAKPSAKK